MTLIELQDVLGQNIKSVNDIKTDGSVSTEEVKAIYGKAENIARLAKQMINNADVVLRSDKLIAEGKIQKTDAISKLVGD